MTRRCLLLCARRSKQMRSVSSMANEGIAAATPTRPDRHLQRQFNCTHMCTAEMHKLTEVKVLMHATCNLRNC